MAIVVKVNGGLGNQMFQYALARKLSASLNVPVVLDLSFFELERGIHTARPYELGHFAPTLLPATSNTLAEFEKIRGSAMVQRMDKWLPFTQSRHLFQEKEFTYDPSVLKIGDHTYVDGHWQTERYFDDSTPLIRTEFTFQAPYSAVDGEIVNRMEHGNSVSIHIRRGDYLTNKAAAAYHGVCDMAYYLRALKYLEERHQGLELFVFSDEIDQARAELKSSWPTTFVGHNTGANSFADMRLMAHSKHHIIANSSFSWWGAWLGNKAGGTVIAPSKWFLDPTINTHDLIPNRWTRL